MSFMAAAPLFASAAMPASVAAVPAAAGIFSAYGGTAIASGLTFGEGVLIGSTVLDAFGGLAEASNKSAMSKAQAQLAEQNAARNEAAARRETARRLGAMKAAFGKSGVQMAGTPVEVLSETASEGELDALTERWSGQSEASILRRRADDEYTSGLIGAGTSLLSGGSKIYDRWASRNPTRKS